MTLYDSMTDTSPSKISPKTAPGTRFEEGHFLEDEKVPSDSIPCENASPGTLQLLHCWKAPGPPEAAHAAAAAEGFDGAGGRRAGATGGWRGFRGRGGGVCPRLLTININ